MWIIKRKGVNHPSMFESCKEFRDLLGSIILEERHLRNLFTVVLNQVHFLQFLDTLF